MNTTIKKHTCKHEYQDKIYGKQMRLINISGKDRTQGKCTVCEQTIKI